MSLDLRDKHSCVFSLGPVAISTMSTLPGVVEVTNSVYSHVTESHTDPTADETAKIIQHVEVEAMRPGLPDAPFNSEYYMMNNWEPHPAAKLTYENVVGTGPSKTTMQPLKILPPQRITPGPYPIRTFETLPGSPHPVPLTPPPSGIVGPQPNPSACPAYRDVNGNAMYVTHHSLGITPASDLDAKFIKMDNQLESRSANQSGNRSPIIRSACPYYPNTQIVYPPVEIMDDGIREHITRAPRRIPHEVLEIDNASEHEYKLAEYNSSLLYLNLRLKGTEAYRQLPFLTNENGIVVFLPKGTPLPNVYKRPSLEALNAGRPVARRRVAKGSQSPSMVSSQVTHVASAYSRISRPKSIRRSDFFTCCSGPKLEKEEEDLRSYTSSHSGLNTCVTAEQSYYHGE